MLNLPKYCGHLARPLMNKKLSFVSGDPFIRGSAAIVAKSAMSVKVSMYQSIILSSLHDIGLRKAFIHTVALKNYFFKSIVCFF